MKCFKCGSENPYGNVFCTNCGTNLTVPVGLCPQCRSPFLPHARFCRICGKSLTATDTVNVITNSKPVPRPKTKKLLYIWIGILTVLVVVVITVFITAMLAGQLGNGDQDSKTSIEERRITTDEESSDDEESSEMTNTSKETAAFAITDKNLIGLWSTEASSGGMVDPDSGYSTGNIYDGTWYLFSSDGTYRYMMVGSGNIISGIVVLEGNYSVSNGKIYLTDVKASWYPDPAQSGQEEAYKDKDYDDQTLYYQFIGGMDTLKINDNEKFHRIVGND